MHKQRKKTTERSIVFLDIDGTLITPSQKPNTNLLSHFICRLARRGILFGLNSNRSFEDLIPLYRRFRLNGPMILENGVYFLKNATGKKTFLTRNVRRDGKTLLTHAINDFIKREKVKVFFYLGDSTRIITSKNLRRIPVAIIANGFRRFTGSIHVFRYGRRDIWLALRLARFLRSFFSRSNARFEVCVTKAFGNITFHPKGVNKGLALKKLRSFFPTYNFFMIGDDIDDLETIKAAHGFFAVGNAQPEVKRRADYVAKASYTKGVIEILRHFEKSLAN